MGLSPRKNNLNRILLIITLFAIVLFPLVYGKGSPTNPAGISPTNKCDRPYADITSDIIKRTGANGILTLNPNELNSNMFAFNVYNRTTNTYYHFLYDIGPDGLWDTKDDEPYSIASFPGGGFGVSMTSKSNNGSAYYWTVGNNTALKIYSCKLSDKGCTGTNLIATFMPYEPFSGILPSLNQNRLYLVSEDPPTASMSSNIYSCSLDPNASDACVLASLSNFTHHGHIGEVTSAFEDLGFSYIPDTAIGQEFFEILNASSFSLPNGVTPSVKSAAQAYPLLFTFTRDKFTVPADSTTYSSPIYYNGSFIFIDTYSKTITHLAGISSDNIVPLITDLYAGTIVTAYISGNRHLVKKIGLPPVEAYSANGGASPYYPIPLTLESDLHIIATQNINNEIHIYRSPCHG